MPNSSTFTIKPIHDLIASLFVRTCLLSGRVVDPFCHTSPFKDRCLTNDIDKRVSADFHVDAIDFLKMRGDADTKLVLFDPPYSPRQVSECYKANGKSVNMQTTQASFWSALKSEIGRIVCSNGIVVTCGWNSGGIGQKYGFEIIEILMVAHGGWHNDTIVTVEKKIGPSVATESGRKKNAAEAENTASNSESTPCRCDNVDVNDITGMGRVITCLDCGKSW